MANFLKPPCGISLSWGRTNPAVNIDLVAQIQKGMSERSPRIIFVMHGEKAPAAMCDDWSCIWEFEDNDTKYRDEIYNKLINNCYQT